MRPIARGTVSLVTADRAPGRMAAATTAVARAVRNGDAVAERHARAEVATCRLLSLADATAARGVELSYDQVAEVVEAVTALRSVPAGVARHEMSR